MKYEELTRILEEEKKNTLSKILPEFYSGINGYIKELETANQNISKRHSEEAVLIQYEIKNALSTIDKIFKKRTLKIIKIASARAFSKTPENIIHDIEIMTPQEQEVYHQMRNVIMKYKDESIDLIVGNDNVKVPDIAPQAQDAITIPPANDNDTPLDSEENRLTAPNKSSESENQESVKSGKNDINKEYIVVRLLKDIPEFMGADINTYNLGADDVAVLPKVNARALIKRKVAVQIESTLQVTDDVNYPPTSKGVFSALII